jgi:hypothetical protein
MWPKLTNIEPNIASKIKSYSDSMEASKLNAWIRVFSGAIVGSNQGLIMQSNDSDFKLFKAAGDTNPTIYGGLQSSGVLGKDWNGNAVETALGRRLRPSPIITSFSVKEGKDQISRQATLEIKAFSLEQMEKIQSYFLEPGYSLYIEWGWNTTDGVRNITTATGTGNIVSTIADKSLSWTNLSNTRKNSNGEFDCFLGFIVGGNVSGDSENFNISVNLRGAPSLPTYMQTNQGTTRIDADGKLAESRKVKKPFGTVESETEASQLRRFGKMFNDLPAFRQTIDIANLKSSVIPTQFINFDEVVRKQVHAAVSPNWLSDAAIEVDLVSSDGSETKEIEIVKEDLFSSHRYIRMDLAVEILNKIGSLDAYKIGGKEITFKIDINNTVIGSFPNQFSTKADKLIIPGTVPDFFQYYLQSNEIEQLNGGKLLVNDKTIEPRWAKDGLEIFRPNSDLNQFGFKEKAGYWGYLKFLFVNFEMFKYKIEQKNKNIREIFLDILNEMSSAVNSFWNFQIVEGESDGNINVTVIDENFIGQNPTETQPVSFRHVGNGSVFLDANIDISIPAEMTNQIVATRLGNSSNPDEAIVSTSKKSFFETGGDLFISATSTPATDTTTENVEPAPDPVPAGPTKQDEIDALLKRQADLLAQREKIPNDRNDANRTERIRLYQASNAAGSDARKLQRELQAEATAAAAAAEAAVKAEQKAQVEAAATTLTANLSKLTVVPLSKLDKLVGKDGKKPLGSEELNDQDELTNLINLKQNFMIYSFDDTEFLDRLKREAFGNKGEGSLSHPLPIKYSFKILGNSGIRRGDMFNILGIPAKYAAKGLFQVTQIEHSLEGNQWFTNITGDYRQIQ